MHGYILHQLQDILNGNRLWIMDRPLLIFSLAVNICAIIKVKVIIDYCALTIHIVTKVKSVKVFPFIETLPLLNCL